MKKIMMVMVTMMLAGVAVAGPYGCGGWSPCRPCPRPYYGCGGCDWWGRGGRNFWPGFIGGVVGGVVASAVARPAYTTSAYVAPTVVQQRVIVQQPVVVPQPVVVQQPVVTQPVVVQSAPVTTVRDVWVEGRYVDRVQANGAVARVWQPGHFEQMTVVVP